MYLEAALVVQDGFAGPATVRYFDVSWFSRCLWIKSSYDRLD
jgi:hypothetical protein